MDADPTFYEYERRFLVPDAAALLGEERGNLMVQAYLFSRNGYAVRVRRTHYPDQAGGHREGPAFVAAKGPRRHGAREEYEMEVPPSFATELIKRAEHTVSKTRYQVVDGGETWDVDVFHGDNHGLAIAECESRSVRRIEVPAWCGAEVTDDPRYNNENLAETPFTRWAAS
ncbi:CYTH domain-containing protein [Plantactinospora endophytica]|uniref:CYTH domain-containing protein n=1 Tax=Plantactinospora endophytica TaxID=673535 RepID=A0ABQ4DS64_9ACTN|nr:hypothetical protein [Plantactinospora endophytica]GIG85301.1 hypothetical protein Pen02_02370 [Plantactinospora endophytica]